MRWDDLFDDLEARALADERARWEAEVEDRREHETAQVALVNRLAGTGAAVVGVQLSDATWVEGTVDGVGVGWVLLTAVGARRQVLVTTTAITAVRGLGRHTGPPPSAVAARRTLVLALRALARTREPVLVRTRSGEVRGTLARIGADHVDVQTHDGGRGSDGSALTVPFPALLSVTGTL